MIYDSTAETVAGPDWVPSSPQRLADIHEET
jgi:hypothetical protein